MIPATAATLPPLITARTKPDDISLPAVLYTFNAKVLVRAPVIPLHA